MELVGKVIKTRVTHELWVASRLGDVPESIKRRWYGYLQTGSQTPWPWLVLRRYRDGWKLEAGPFALKEAAYANALQALEDDYVKGFDIEMVGEIDMDTVEVPLGSIDTYFKNLIQQAKDAKKPADLIKLREKITKAQAVCDLLGEAQTQITEKLLNI